MLTALTQICDFGFLKKKKFQKIWNKNMAGKKFPREELTFRGG